jgi:hypothetical protein
VREKRKIYLQVVKSRQERRENKIESKKTTSELTVKESRKKVAAASALA